MTLDTAFEPWDIVWNISVWEIKCKGDFAGRSSFKNKPKHFTSLSYCWWTLTLKLQSHSQYSSSLKYVLLEQINEIIELLSQV